MKLHKEGNATLIGLGVALVLINFVAYYLFMDNLWLHGLLAAASVIFFLMVTSFFRDPKRNIVVNESNFLSPCDGKVVVIEETQEPEYFKDKRVQVSIFMSPANVHINRNPIAGEVKYVKYHAGKYLVAWHPKSSTENERNTVVIQNNKTVVLVRQIAGKVARKIVNYTKEGDKVQQGAELGFIKFGSRVDLFFPVGTKIAVSLEQKVVGGETVIATLS
jgi:phosphatidylserine decarboxylase